MEQNMQRCISELYFCFTQTFLEDLFCDLQQKTIITVQICNICMNKMYVVDASASSAKSEKIELEK